MRILCLLAQGPGSNKHLHKGPMAGAKDTIGSRSPDSESLTRLYGEHGLMWSFHAERHPDNVAASLFGGFVGTYLNELKPEDVARKEIPLSEVLPAPAGGIDTGVKPPEPPLGIGHYRKFDWAPEIKAIAIIPDFVVPTANARNVLPQTYTRADVVSVETKKGHRELSPFPLNVDQIACNFSPLRIRATSS